MKNKLKMVLHKLTFKSGYIVWGYEKSKKHVRLNYTLYRARTLIFYLLEVYEATLVAE